jgi:Vanillate O-demethylase oxygenase C-terminal domain
VPAMPGCPLEGRKAVDSYSVLETNDAVFVYFPSKERPDAPELNLPAEFSDPAWSGILCMGRWDCSYRLVYDNFADPMHACYLHANSFTLAFGAKQDVLQVEKRDDGFHIARVEQKDVNLDWTDVIIDGTQVYCRLDIPYPDAAGPGGPFRIIGYTTPVDEHSCMVFFWRFRQVEGIARESWRFLYRATLEARHWHVLEQDREMLTHIPEDAHKREMLYQHDVGVARMRRILSQQAKSQLAAEEMAAVRTAV